jgi:hypothetical protein
VLLRPLGGLSFGGAEATWLVAGMALLGICWWLTVRGLGLRSVERRMAALMAVLLPGAWWCLQQGQLNIPVLALMLSATLALARRRDGLSGALLGAAIAIKGFPLLLALYLAWAARWRALAACAVVATGLTAAGLAFAAPDSHLYLTRVLPTQLVPSPSYDNYSLPAVLQRHLVANPYGSQLADLPGVAAVGSRLVVLALVATTLWLEPGGRGKSPAVAMVGLMALLPLTITTSWKSSALLGYPALWAAGAWLVRHPGRDLPAKALTALAILLCAASPALRLVHYGVGGTAHAIAARDPVFYLWGLDMTAGFVLAWTTFLLGSRSRSGGDSRAGAAAIAASWSVAGSEPSGAQATG